MADAHWSEHKPWDKWTDKERLFAHEYLIDQNMTQAAIRAGYSAKSAVKIAHELYHKPHIKGWIEERLKSHCKELDISAKAILQEVALVAFQNLSGAFNLDGSLKNIHEMPEHIQRVLAGVDVDELFQGKGEDREQIGVTKKIRTWDKMKALELLGKNKKLWTDKVIVNERPKVFLRDLTGKKSKD